MPPPGQAAMEVVAELLEAVPDVAFFVKDRTGRYVAVNRSLLQRVGLRHRRELLGKRVSEVFPPDLAGRYAAQDEAVLRTGQAVRDQLELHWRVNHQRGWCLTTKLPLRDESGTVTGLVGISRDVRAPGDDQGVPEGIAKALRHLQRHHADKISTSQLATWAGVSSVKFARLAKRLFSLTPSQLIIQARLNAAAEMLHRTRQSIAEIGIACGFADHSAFSRAFRRWVGCLPSEYRARV